MYNFAEVKKYGFFLHLPEKWKEWKQKPHFCKVRWNSEKYGFDFHSYHL